MIQSHEDKSSILKQQKSKNQSINSHSMKQINKLKLKKFGKCFNIVDSPEIVFDLCDKVHIKSRQIVADDKKQNFDVFKAGNSHKNPFLKQKINITKNLLEQKRKSLQKHNYLTVRQPKLSYHKENRHNKSPQSTHSHTTYNQKLSHLSSRQFYKQIKSQLHQFITKIQQQKQTTISQVLLLKQDILSSFFSQIIQKQKIQCKQKGNLIHYIWNSMWSILQIAIKQLTLEKNHNQKNYLQDNLQNHKLYQQMLEIDQQRIVKFKKQLQKEKVFNNTLIFNLRCKRRQLRKTYQKLKLCTNKLNEYKESYLDLQKDHIDLLMDSRDISREIAEYLIKRRQQILQDKKKTFKLKFNKKTNSQNTKKQISIEPKQQTEKITAQLKCAYNKEYQKQLEIAQGQNKKLKKLTNFLFQDAMDQFAFYQNNDDINDDIIAEKMKTTFVDVQTDMTGFQFDTNDVECQIDYIEKIVLGLSKNQAAQTPLPEQKVKKIYVENQVQVQSTHINQLKLNHHFKIYDLSFLFQGKGVNNNSNNLQSTRKLNNSQQKSGSKSNKKIYFKRNSISLNSKQGSQISINIGSKSLLQSRKRISQRAQKQEMDQKNYQIRNNKNQNDQKQVKANLYRQYQQQNDDQNISQISDAFNFEQYTMKFALKKGLRKHKKFTLGTLIEKQKDLMSSDQQLDQEGGKKKYLNSTDGNIFGFIKTRKNSRFSQENFIKRNSDSISPSKKQSKKKNKKTNFQQSSFYNNDQKNTKRKLKRQPLLTNTNKNEPTKSASLQSVQSRVNQTQFNKSPQKSQLMKILATKSRKQQSVKLTIQTIKQQNPHLEINEQQMKQYLQSKKAQQQQNFFKNFYQSIQPLTNDLYKNIQKTKNYYKKLLPARQKNLCKIISNVYLQAYQSIQKKQKIFTLINPLFRFFQIGYGLLKNYDLYSRMISFLSHIYLHKDQSNIFYSFFFFTGIDKENPLSQKITSQDVLLYLKLLKSLSYNFNLESGIMGLNVQNLYTSNVVLEKNMKQVLMEEKFNEVLIEKVMNKVHEKLFQLTGVDVRSNSRSHGYQGAKDIFSNTFKTMNSKTSPNSFHSTSRSLYSNYDSDTNRTFSQWNNPFQTSSTSPNHKSNNKPFSSQQPAQQQLKLDVFKCCQLIIQQIITIKKSIQQSYIPLINHVYQQPQSSQEYQVQQSIIQFIIKCQFRSKFSEVKSYQTLKNMFKINSLYNQYKEKYLEKGMEKENKNEEKQTKEMKTFRTLKTIKFIEDGEEYIQNGNSNTPKIDIIRSSIQEDSKSNPTKQKQHTSSKQALTLNDMCSFFLKTNISDFNKTYYNALNVFKLRQETSLNLCLTKLTQIRKILQKYSMKVELILLQEITDQLDDQFMWTAGAGTGSVYSFMNNINVNSTPPSNSNFLLTHLSPNTQPNLSPNHLMIPGQANFRRQSYNSNISSTSNPISLKQIHNRKLLNLCFLRVVEHKSNQVLDEIMGKDLGILYNWLPISKLRL